MHPLADFRRKSFFSSYYLYIGAAIALTFIAVYRGAWAQSSTKTPATITDQLSTEERLRKAGWWPTKGTFPRDQFVGSDTCARCHPALARTQRESAMAKTATLAAKSEILQNHSLDYHLGPFSYQAAVQADGVTYRVSNASPQAISGPLTWSFGIRMGQSYFFDYKNHIYLVPLTYYPETQAFGFTVDQPHTVPDSLGKAIGRPLKDEEIRGCFDCHTTASTTNGHFDPQHSMPGVTCEACHGPGASHVATMTTSADSEQKMILNPGGLGPVDLVDFCGSCHRTWWDVTLGGLAGPKSLRFQPYRIENSRCWGKGDARLTCIACHDPHKPLVRETATYDKYCLRCHVNAADAKAMADHPGTACKVATKDCVTCHMPQSTVIDIPVKFTDHQIRVVRSNDRSPN